MSNELDPLTRLIMLAESLDHDTCPECGAGEDDSTVLREVHAAMTERLTAAEMALEHQKEANTRLRAALKRRVLGEEVQVTGKLMTSDELNEFCDYIEKDGLL